MPAAPVIAYPNSGATIPGSKKNFNAVKQAVNAVYATSRKTAIIAMGGPQAVALAVTAAITAVTGACTLLAVMMQMMMMMQAMMMTQSKCDAVHAILSKLV